MKKLYAYTVKPERGRRYTLFPFDMLRYDQAWPSDPHAVELMMTPIGDRLPNEDLSVRLTGIQAPTVARWESFGWLVLEAKEMRL